MQRWRPQKKLNETRKIQIWIRRNPIRFVQRWPVSELNQDESQEMLRVCDDGQPFWKLRWAWGKIYGLERHHNIRPGRTGLTKICPALRRLSGLVRLDKFRKEKKITKRTCLTKMMTDFFTKPTKNCVHSAYSPLEGRHSRHKMNCFLSKYEN